MAQHATPKTHIVQGDSIFIENNNDIHNPHIQVVTEGNLNDNDIELVNCNVNIKSGGFVKAPEIRTTVIKDVAGNTTMTLSSTAIDFHGKTINNLTLGSGSVSASSVSSANGYASLDAELDALTTNKVSITGHTSSKVFVSSAGGGIITSSITTTELAKLSTLDLNAITLNTAKTSYTDAVAVGLNTAKISYTDAAAVSANTSKTSYTDAVAVGLNTAKISYTDAAAVSANTSKTSYTDAVAVGLNTAKISYTDAAAVSANTSKTSYTGAVDVAASKAVTDYITVTNPVNLSTVETKSLNSHQQGEDVYVAGDILSCGGDASAGITDGAFEIWRNRNLGGGYRARFELPTSIGQNITITLPYETSTLSTLALGTTSTTALVGNTTTISAGQAALINTNQSGISTNSGNITSNDVDIAANTAAGNLNTTFRTTNTSIIASHTSSISTINTNVTNNAYKLTGISYTEFGTAGDINIDAGNYGGVSSLYDNGDVNIRAGFDSGTNSPGYVMIGVNNTEAIKSTSTETTIYKKLVANLSAELTGTLLTKTTASNGTYLNQNQLWTKDGAILYLNYSTNGNIQMGSVSSSVGIGHAPSIDKLNINGGLVVNGSGFQGRMRIGTTGYYNSIAGGSPQTQVGLLIESNAGGEGSMIYLNGNESGVINPGDYWTWAWHDEDTATGWTTYWKMNTSGGITASSDRRLKENIRFYSDEYDMKTIKEKYSQIKFCKWNRKKLLKDPSGKKPDNHSLIAQEMELLFPEMITTNPNKKGEPDENGMKSLNFQFLDIMSKHIMQDLVKNEKVLQDKVATLESELTILKAQVKILLEK